MVLDDGKSDGILDNVACVVLSSVVGDNEVPNDMMGNVALNDIHWDK